jgi:hypothetical protein
MSFSCLSPWCQTEAGYLQDRYVRNIFSHRANRPKYISIILSLPEAFLLWSMISFAVAALAFNLQGGIFTVGVTFVLSIFVIVAVAMVLVLEMMRYVWGRGSIVSRIYRKFESV